MDYRPRKKRFIERFLQDNQASDWIFCDEISQHIFSYLPLRDFIKCRTTCKYIKNLMDDSVLWLRFIPECYQDFLKYHTVVELQKYVSTFSTLQRHGCAYMLIFTDTLKSLLFYFVVEDIMWIRIEGIYL